MQARQDPDDRLRALAVGQAGVLVQPQVAVAGIGRHAVARLVASGQWRRLDRSVYYVQLGEPGWLSWSWAGLLLGGPDARLAGRAAAHLYGMTEVEPWPIPLLVPHEAPVRSRPPWVYHREHAGVREARSPGSPARTTVEDTVLDLTEEEPDPRQVISWVTLAVQSRHTTVKRLGRAVQRRRRLRHRSLLLDLLADVAEGAETPLELAYLRDVERAHGLPRGRRQAPSRAAPYRRDVLYEEYATVVELDGRVGHEGMGRFRDMRRDNVATLQGEASLRYGWPDVSGECCSVAFQVGSVLGIRGWPGTPHRCRRCADVPLELIG